MKCSRNARKAQPPKPPTVKDQEFEERKRIAEDIVRALREAKYCCDLVDGGSARTLRRDN